MKILPPFLAVTMLSSCATSLVLDEAKGSKSSSGSEKEIKGKPGYYLLVPLTVPADIITFPFILWGMKDIHC